MYLAGDMQSFCHIHSQESVSALFLAGDDTRRLPQPLPQPLQTFVFTWIYSTLPWLTDH